MAFPWEVVIILLLVLAVVAYAYFFLTKSSAKFTTVKIGNRSINAEIADTVVKKMNGLMFRKSLGEIDGMLFVFDEHNYPGIWMMNMSFPIDIIWINSSKEVVYIQKDAQPCSVTSCPTYKPSEAAMFVLEVNAGFCDKHNIKVGSKAEFRSPDV